MKTNIIPNFILAIIAFLSTLVFTTAQAQNKENEKTIEEYFLVRCLESLYENWPNDLTIPDEFAAAAQDLRNEAHKLKIRSKRAEVHSSIIKGYQDLIIQLDNYTEFLHKIGAIHITTKGEGIKDETDSVIKGGAAAVGIYSSLSQNENFSDREAALMSLLIGGITYAVDSWGKRAKRNEAEQRSIKTESQRIQDTFTVTLEATRQGFLDLAKLRGWDKNEIGWNLSPAHAQSILAMYERADIKELTREASRQRNQRPNDPFIGLQHNLLQAIQDENNAVILTRLSEDSYRLRRLIPSNATYSDYHFSVAFQSALIASLARSEERKHGAPARSSERSKRAVELWNSALQLGQNDPTGYVRMFRAGAYASDGNTKEARRELNALQPKLKDCGYYLYSVAVVYCLDQEYDQSMTYLKRALMTDMFYDSLKDVRSDPELSNLRRLRRNEFDKITIPQWKWNVKNGLFFADVTLTNNSAFTLTNVKLISTTQGWKPDLEVEFILPGETKKWGWVSKTPSGSSTTVRLQCDQNP